MLLYWAYVGPPAYFCIAFLKQLVSRETIWNCQIFKSKSDCFSVDVNEGAGTVTICAEKVGVPGKDITCARDEEKKQSLVALAPICFDILSFDIPPF